MSITKLVIYFLIAPTDAIASMSDINFKFESCSLTSVDDTDIYCDRFDFKSSWNIVYSATVSGYFVEINNKSKYLRLYNSELNGGNAFERYYLIRGPRNRNHTFTFNILYS